MSDRIFVPNGESRLDTAILLVGTADEFGISQRDIQTTPAGFYISEELDAVLYSEADKPNKRSKKTSGNRAAKTVTEKE